MRTERLNDDERYGQAQSVDVAVSVGQVQMLRAKAKSGGYATAHLAGSARNSAGPPAQALAVATFCCLAYLASGYSVPAPCCSHCCRWQGPTPPRCCKAWSKPGANLAGTPLLCLPPRQAERPRVTCRSGTAERSKRRFLLFASLATTMGEGGGGAERGCCPVPCLPSQWSQAVQSRELGPRSGKQSMWAWKMANWRIW